METMNYDKIKNKSNAPFISFVTFILLGSGVVAYTLINEQKPVIIGENPLVQVDSPNVQEQPENKEIEYAIKSVSRTENNTSYKASIVLPEISVDNVDLTDINEQIKNRFVSKYELLEKDTAGNLENDFTYKVTYKTYEMETNDTKVLSILIDETIAAGKSDTFSSKKYGYVIDLGKKILLSQDEAAPLILGYSYRNDIKEALKDYIVDNNIVSEDDYNYSITGLEEFYIKDNEFHIIFNPSEPFDEKFGIIDITMEE